MSEATKKAQQIELMWRYFYQQGSLPTELTNAELKVAVPRTIDIMVMQLITHIAGERVEEIRYPLDWWQAIRERWLPVFWLRLYPVKYKHWKMDFLYPKIRTSEEPMIALYHNRGPAGYPHWEDEKVIYRKKRDGVPAWLWVLLSVPEED